MLPAGSVADPVAVSLGDWAFTGDESGDNVGYTVSSAGDLNDDGWDDVVVGAPYDTGLVAAEGVVYVFHGSAGGLSLVPDQTLSAGQKGARFGWSVSTAGDVNDDGLDDLLVGAPEYDNGEYQVGKVGRVYLYLGVPGVGVSPTYSWSYTGTVKMGDLGYAVNTAGDMNDDGYDDIVVGSPHYTDDPEGDEQNEGAVLVFYGQDGAPFLSLVPDWTYESNQAGAQLGSAVGTAGDVNNDTYDDIIAGAPTYDNTQANEGAAYLFLGSSLGPGTSPDWTSYGGQADAWFGASVGTAGRVNGDAYADIVVGAPRYSNVPDVHEGAAFAFCGMGSSPGLGSAPCWSKTSDQAASWFGASVGTAGDVDGDGFDDIVVGAYEYEPVPGTGYQGAAFIFYGSGTGLRPWAGWMAGGDKAQTEFGFSVGTAGNVYDGGTSDVVVGAPRYFHEHDAQGRAFAFYGPLEPAPVHQTFLPLVAR